MANLTLEDIANISFPRANFGGYRAEDVDAFIFHLEGIKKILEKIKE